ncbi:MAG: isopeptide-forming domain-containing fimbrial protein [Clostridia bacterium]
MKSFCKRCLAVLLAVVLVWLPMGSLAEITTSDSISLRDVFVVQNAATPVGTAEFKVTVTPPTTEVGKPITFDLLASYATTTSQESCSFRVTLEGWTEAVVCNYFDSIAEGATVTFTTVKGSAITYTLHVPSGGAPYIDFAVPAGDSISLNLQFTAKNGVSGENKSMTVTPSVISPNVEQKVAPPVSGTWTGTFDWNAAKTQDASQLKIGTDEKLSASNSASGTPSQIKYTVSATSANRGATGKVWTEALYVTDTLTLPKGVSLPAGYTISANHQQILYHNQVIYQANLPAGWSASELSVAPQADGSTQIVLKANAQNANPPAGELADMSFPVTLAVDQLQVAPTVQGGEKITNKAALTADAYNSHLTAQKEQTVEAVISPRSTDLGIVKTADKTTVAAGETVRYTVTVTNKGTADAKDKLITDTLPKGLTLTAAQQAALTAQGASVVFDAGSQSYTISWANQQIARNGSWVQSFDATVAEQAVLDGLQSNVLSNRASIDVLWDNADVTVPMPDLSIAKSQKIMSGKTHVAAGDGIEYTVTVTNRGGADAIGKTIVDTLPKGITLTQAQKTALTNQGAAIATDAATGTTTLTWVNQTIPANGTWTKTFQTTVDSQDKLANLQSLTNAATVDDKRAEVTVPIAKPSLTIAKTAVIQGGKQQVTTGDVIEYTVTVSNSGTADATGKTIVDTLPKGITLTEAQKTALTNQGAAVATDAATGTTTLTWVNQTIPANGTWTQTFQTTVDSQDKLANLQGLTNVATVDDKRAEVTVPIAKPSLTVTKSSTLPVGKTQVAAGDVITYVITVKNNGTADATGVNVVDTLPIGLVLSAEQKLALENLGAVVATDGAGLTTLTWSHQTIPAGMEWSKTFQATVTTDAAVLDPITILRNTVVAGDGGASDDVPVEKPTLTLTKEHTCAICQSGGKHKAGEIIDFTMTATNASAVPAKNVVLSDTLPAQLIPVDDSGAALAMGTHTIGGHTVTLSQSNGQITVTWNFAEIPASTTVTLTLKTKLGSLAGVTGDLVHNTFGGMGGTVVEPIPVDKQMDFDKNILLADGSKVKSSELSAGCTVTYLVELMNTADVAQTFKAVTDVLPVPWKAFAYDARIAYAAVEGCPSLGTPALAADPSTFGTTTLSWGDVTVAPKTTAALKIQITFPTGEEWMNYLAQVNAHPWEPPINTFSYVGGSKRVEHTVSQLDPRVDIDKNILLADGSKGKACEITSGCTITYLVELINNAPTAQTFTDVKDYLPTPWSAFTYNGRITYADEAGCTPMGTPSMTAVSWDEGKTTLAWSPVTVPANAKAAQRVSITFPEGDAWTNYKKAQEAHSGKPILNTLTFAKKSVSVTHTLPALESALYMQKGVVKLAELKADNWAPYAKHMSNACTGTSLKHYIQDNSFAVYYFAVLNTGEAPMTIQTAVDTLPSAVTFKGLLAKPLEYWEDTKLQTITTGDQYGTYLIRPSDFALLSRPVSAAASGQTLTFTFGDAAGITLAPKEGITFAYACAIDPAYGNPSTNSVALRVAGNVLQKNAQVSQSNGANGRPNDGGCSRSYDAALNQTTFTSEVTIVPVKDKQQITPGIEKKLVGYLPDGNKAETPIAGMKPLSTQTVVNAVDSLQWRITLHNDGINKMELNSLTDVLDSPYTLSKVSERAPKLEYVTAGGSRRTVAVPAHTETKDGAATRYTFDFRNADGTANSLYTLAAGETAVLTLITDNISNTYAAKTYVNRAILKPMVSFQDSSCGVNGNPDAGGLYTTVEAEDKITIRQQFSTTSWKKVVDVADPNNAAYSQEATTAGKNYIVVKDEGGKVDYTLFIENNGYSDLNTLCIIDNLPHAGDQGPVSPEARGSDFEVKLISTPSLAMLDADGNSVPLTAGTDFTLSYSTKKDGFGDADYKGNAGGWNASLASANTLRIYMTKPLKPNAKIMVSFRGQIDAATAEPGKVAWNSFGYEWTNGTNHLRPAPPRVGVAIEQTKVNFNFTKVDSQSQAALAEVGFTLTALDAGLGGPWTAKSGADGLVSFANLRVGRYRLEETSTPGGYTKVSGHWEVEVRKVLNPQSGIYELQPIITPQNGAPAFLTQADGTLLLPNEKPPILPQTGGGGTYGLTTSGLMLMLLAGLWYAFNRRRSGREGRGA